MNKKHPISITKRSGITLLEILFTFVIISLLSVMMIPKLLVTDDDMKVQVIGRTKDIMANMSMSLQIYQADSGTGLNFGTKTLQSIFEEYGNYFLYKADGNRHYYLTIDGSRITFSKNLFYDNGSLAEYSPPPIGPADINNPWRDPDTDTGTCGDYPDNQCFFVDLNGEKDTNTTGENGELVAFRVDPNNGQIRTLYEWERDDQSRTAPILCRFISIYETKTGVTCP